MPDPTPLIIARKRYSDEWVEQLHALLLQKLNEDQVLKHRTFRTDTTSSNPTCIIATLLHDCVKVITRL